jgi:hypothetical protein
VNSCILSNFVGREGTPIKRRLCNIVMGADGLAVNRKKTTPERLSSVYTMALFIVFALTVVSIFVEIGLAVFAKSELRLLSHGSIGELGPSLRGAAKHQSRPLAHPPGFFSVAESGRYAFKPL